MGSPIDIPSIVQDQGRPLDEVLGEIESGIRDQCGGELCVGLRVENSDENFTECQFVATDPPQGSEVERGSTVVVIAGTEPCDEDEQSDDETGETGEPAEEPTEDEQPTEDDQSEDGGGEIGETGETGESAEEPTEVDQ